MNSYKLLKFSNQPIFYKMNLFDKILNSSSLN